METLKSRNGWTVEFYVRRSSEVSAWEYLLGINDGVGYTGKDGRFSLSYRTNGFVLFEQMQTQNATGGLGIDDKAFPTTVKDLAVGDWHHVALTFCVSAGNGVYELFVDGESCGTLSAALRAEAKMGTSPLLYVGGRPWSDQSFKGELSSIRLSDVVLAPSEFLCAKKDIPEESPQTLAYWPLDGSGSALPGEDLSGQGNPISEFLNVRPIKRGDAAFRFLPVDDPIVAAGDFVKNLGAVSLDGVQAYLLSASVGSNLNRDASFTVEGWLRTHAESETTDEEVVVGNFDPVERVGWKLSVVRVDGARRFRVFARGASGLSPLVDATFDGAVPTDWKHMALTYDVEASEGRWSLYVDRTKIGEAKGYYHPGKVGLGQTAFALGLKGERQGLRALSGDYDVWRVSSGVLASDAFLPDGLNRGRGTLLLFR